MLHKKNFQLNSKTNLRLQQHRKMSFHRTHVWMDIYLYQGTPDLCLGCSKYGSRFHRSHKSPAHLQSIVSRLSSHHKVSHSGKILKIHRSRKSTKTSLKVSSTKKCWEFSDHNTTSLWYTQQGRVRGTNLSYFWWGDQSCTAWPAHRGQGLQLNTGFCYLPTSLIRFLCSSLKSTRPSE